MELSLPQFRMKGLRAVVTMTMVNVVVKLVMNVEIVAWTEVVKVKVILIVFSSATCPNKP
jgi:hypothetical protein